MTADCKTSIIAFIFWIWHYIVLRPAQEIKAITIEANMNETICKLNGAFGVQQSDSTAQHFANTQLSLCHCFFKLVHYTRRAVKLHNQSTCTLIGLGNFDQHFCWCVGGCSLINDGYIIKSILVGQWSTVAWLLTYTGPMVAW